MRTDDRGAAHYASPVLRVGLTGGIGAGKSVVAGLLAARGAVVVDADALAREVVQPGTPGLAEVARAFGPHLLRPDGSLDREALGAVVFADPDARRRLEGITHPRIRELTAARMAGVPPGTVVVHDVPLLVEAGLADAYDVVLVVEAADAVRLERLERDRGMAAEVARARMAAQATRQQRAAVADVVLVNDRTRDELERRVAEVWPDLERRARAAAAPG